MLEQLVSGHAQAQEPTLLNRRMRRKRSWLQAAAESSSQQLAGQLPNGAACTDQMQCRLETHLWHAKRFRMANRCVDRNMHQIGASMSQSGAS